MLVENSVFVKASRLPSATAWSRAIRRYGFDMLMSTHFPLDHHKGFLACSYRRESADVEYFADPIDVQELLREDVLTGDEAAEIGDRDFLISIVSAEPRQHISSIIATCVLCALADGKLAEAGEAPFISAEKAIAWARKREAELSIGHDRGLNGRTGETFFGSL